MKKKLCTIILAFVMMTSFIVEVYAEEAQDNYGVEPFYTNTSLVTANLRLSGATAICNAQNVMTKNKKSKITMTLQKSSDKSTYSKVKAWSQESTGTGNKTLEKRNAITKGYYYRLRVVVRIYSGTEVIEKITKYSTVKYY